MYTYICSCTKYCIKLDTLKCVHTFTFQANRTFVEMRRDMMETRTALESTVKLHKESVQKQRSIELEIMVW